MANKLSLEKKASVVAMLCEGASIRGIERMTGVNRNTIMSLGLRMGDGCQKIMDEKLRNLNCKRIEVDEVWGFIGMKQAAARVEGEESDWYIKCDLDDSTGKLYAVLFWPTETDARRVVHELDAGELSPSTSEGVSYVYTGSPIPIPKALAFLRPAPLSSDAERLGFFRIE